MDNDFDMVGDTDSIQSDAVDTDISDDFGSNDISDNVGEDMNADTADNISDDSGSDLNGNLNADVNDDSEVEQNLDVDTGINEGDVASDDTGGDHGADTDISDNVEEDLNSSTDEGISTVTDNDLSENSNADVYDNSGEDLNAEVGDDISDDGDIAEDMSDIQGADADISDNAGENLEAIAVEEINEVTDNDLNGSLNAAESDSTVDDLSVDLDNSNISEDVVANGEDINITEENGSIENGDTDLDDNIEENAELDVASDDGVDLNDGMADIHDDEAAVSASDSAGEDLNTEEANGIKANAEDWQPDEIVDISHGESDSDFGDEKSISSDLTPSDIQADIEALEQEISDDANSLDGKYEEQTDLSYVNDEYSNDEEPNITSEISSETPSYDTADVNDSESMELPDDSDGFLEQERLGEILSGFKQENWDKLTSGEQKEAIGQLADYNADVLGIKNKPNIVYYNNEDPGDYGYSLEGEIGINEYTMGDSNETADTIAHEYRHQYQREQSQNPQSELDLKFRDNFENYIRPEDDFQGYQDQILESDAREYAQRLKDRI